MRTRRTNWLWRALAGAIGLVVAAHPAAAQEPEPEREILPSPVPADTASISAELASVAVDSPDYRAAQRHVDRTASALAAASRTKTEAEARLVTLHARQVQLNDSISADSATRRDVAAALAQVEDGLRELAVDAYVHGRNLDTLMPIADADSATEVGASRVVFEAVGIDQRQAAADLEARHDQLTRTIAEHVEERAAVRDDIVGTEQTRDRAAADEVRLAGELTQQQATVEQARAMATLVGTDFPLVALDAYWRAAHEVATAQPECGVPWWALAGITRVESRHGSYGGANLLPNGDTDKPIIGIPLDGTNNTRHIPDTDGGSLDGDPVVDRAVGPMQFIPSTWARWAGDGNGDAIANPHNLYDTALAAARYLCASGPLTDDAGLSRAFFSYNHSEAYVVNVLGWAHRYATLVVPPVSSAA